MNTTHYFATNNLQNIIRETRGKTGKNYNSKITTIVVIDLFRDIVNILTLTIIPNRQNIIKADFILLGLDEYF